MTQQIIGLTGRKRSGKDTVADILCADSHAVRRAFADPLKILAAKALGFDRPDDELIALMDEAKLDFFDGWQISIRKSTNYSKESYNYEGAYMSSPDWYDWHQLDGRKLLQNLGVAARELFGESFWIDQLFAKHKAETPKAPLIVTDVRFDNEALEIRKRGGEVWWIDRPGVVYKDDHSSESGVDPSLMTHKIVNDGTLLDLRTKIFAAKGYDV